MNVGMSTDLIMTTITISMIAHICVNSSDYSSTTTITIVVVVGISFKFTTTNYCGSY